MGNSLSVQDLERVYDSLAEGIDQAGPEKAELYLVKLALLAAQSLGDAQLFCELNESALRDL